jgi:DNA mismatch repair ATPase MutS
MGAGDDLAAGMSTFMTELSRTSSILKQATCRSLVVLDELGRGTATNDGVAIALSTLRYMVEKIGCALLFVTHYPQVGEGRSTICVYACMYIRVCMNVCMYVCMYADILIFAVYTYLLLSITHMCVCLFALDC